METKLINIIIDTDIGDDIDDAIALCLAMKSPEINILGVTTVYKDTGNRAKIAARLLRLGGFGHIPVIAGCSIPLYNHEIYGKEVDFAQKPLSYMSKYNDESYVTTIDARDFIIKTLENSTEPITIATLGALTNIAEVIRRRPDLKNKIKSISMMGGAFLSRNISEYNFSCDPEAAEIVIQSGISITCVGLDVTFQCKLSPQHITNLNKHPHPCIKMLMEMQQIWSNDIFLHDPLAVAVSFDKSLIHTDKIQCKIELGGRYTRGMSVNLSDFNWAIPAESSNVEIAFGVESERVVALCMNRLMSY